MEYMNNKSFKTSDSTVDKLPFFLNNNGSPNSWFRLLEAKFEFSVLSSSNKFYQAISCLPLDILKLLSNDLVDASESCNPYNSLKDLLYDHFKAKPDDIIEEYFSQNSQSGLKPSEYLSKAFHDLELQHPGITKDNDKIMRKFFISSLPLSVQKIMNGISNIELCKLADFADKISEKPPIKSSESFNEMPSDDKSSVVHLTNEIILLKYQFQTLEEKFNSLEKKLIKQKEPEKPQPKPKVRSDSMSPVNSMDISDKNKSKTFCFYHAKYGSSAEKCQLGCTYQPKPADLKISNICIYHAKYIGDNIKCFPACSRYHLYTNGHSSH